METETLETRRQDSLCYMVTTTTKAILPQTTGDVRVDMQGCALLTSTCKLCNARIIHSYPQTLLNKQMHADNIEQKKLF